jgi:hypothetical protein
MRSFSDHAGRDHRRIVGDDAGVHRPERHGFGDVRSRALGTNRISVSIQSDHKVSLKLGRTGGAGGAGGVKYVSPVLNKA